MENWYITEYKCVFGGGNCIVFLSRNVCKCQMHLDSVGAFCIINCYFECVYQILCHFLYIGRDVKDMFDIFWKKKKERRRTQKCEQFSYELFFDILGICWDLFPPPSPSPSPSPASMSKFPSRGNNNMEQMFV